MPFVMLRGVLIYRDKRAGRHHNLFNLPLDERRYQKTLEMSGWLRRPDLSECAARLRCSTAVLDRCVRCSIIWRTETSRRSGSTEYVYRFRSAGELVWRLEGVRCARFALGGC